MRPSRTGIAALFLLLCGSCAGAPARRVEPHAAVVQRPLFDEGFRYPGTGFEVHLISAHPEVTERVQDIGRFADTGDAWAAKTLRVPADYVYCVHPGECRELAHFEAGDQIYLTLPSRSGERELIVHGPLRDVRVDVYGLRSGRRTGTFSAGGWLARLHNTPLRWLGDERILAHWSAGTNVAEAELYDLGGSELLAVSADAIRVSRSNDFLVAWSPVGAPGSEAGNLRLFDLTGRSEAERSVSIPPDARGALPIEDVLFDGGTLVVLVSSDAEELARAIRIPLRT